MCRDRVADVMLNYQSTSYHDAAAMRRLFGLRPAPEFQAWLQATGVFDGNQLAIANDEPRQRLIGQLGNSALPCMQSTFRDDLRQKSCQFHFFVIGLQLRGALPSSHAGNQPGWATEC